MADIKFPLKAYKWEGNTATLGDYELTEQEIMHECCIWANRLVLADGMPWHELKNIDMHSVELYEIWHYDCGWQQWPDNLKEIMYKRVPQSRPKN
jgi:hypothetical protein